MDNELKKLKLRSQKILYIFDKMWWSQKKGRYYNVPKRKYINTNHKYYYRRLKIEVFLGIKYYDPTSRKKFKSVKALENLNIRKGKINKSYKSLTGNGCELSIYEKSLLKRMCEVGTNIIEVTNVWIDLVSDYCKNGNNEIEPNKDRMVADIKQLYKWSLEGDFLYKVDSKGKITKL